LRLNDRLRVNGGDRLLNV